MLMAEGEEDVFENRRAADHRQAVGQRRPEPRPFAGVFGIDAGEHRFRVPQQDPGPGHVGRRLQAAKFRRSGELDPGLDRGGDELPPGGEDGGIQFDPRVGQDDVVAALPLQGHGASQTRRQPPRPGAGGDDDLVHFHRPFIGQKASRAIGSDVDVKDIAQHHHPARLGEVLGQPLDEAVRIDGKAEVRQEVTFLVDRRQRRFAFADLVGADPADVGAALGPEPPGQRVLGR